MAAIILESDMRPGEYYGVAGDRAARAKAEEHCKDKKTSPMLRVLLSKTMLRAEVGTMEGLHCIKKQLRMITFQSHDKFRAPKD